MIVLGVATLIIVFLDGAIEKTKCVPRHNGLLSSLFSLSPHGISLVPIIWPHRASSGYIAARDRPPQSFHAERGDSFTRVITR